MKVYQSIAAKLQAIDNCAASGNTEWENRHADDIEQLVKDYMPHGSGFDMGVTLDFSKSNSQKLVFSAPFHHMDSNGYYCGWRDYTVIVTPDLASGFNMRITGRDYNGAKEYFYELFNECLNEDVKTPETKA